MKQDPELCFWAVAFIDLLGQSEKLDQMTHLPKSEEETQQFKKLFLETFAAINDIHESFKENFEKLANKKKRPSIELSPEISEDEFVKLRTGKVCFQRFSDGLVAFVSLRNDESILPMNGISVLLSSLGILFPAFLAKGIPLRCGVDVGIGMEMNPNELYGPAVKNAYRLESQIAQYPRVILGEEIISYMRNYIPSKPDGTHEISLSKLLAKRWLERCISDVDGYSILNYLGKEFLADVHGENVNRYIYEKALEFIIAELNKHKAQQNTKLAFRYTLLYDYFQYHRSNWAV